MAFLSLDKMFSRGWLISWILIIVGAFIMAAGFVFFISPYKIVPGGVYGIAIVIHHLTKGMFPFFPEGLPIGLMGLIMNIPLTIIGIKVLGPRFGIKTVLGFIIASVMMDLLTMAWGEAPLVEGDALLSSIFGGVLIGLGLGLIFKSRATSGGSDIVAMIIAKYTRLPLGQLLIYVDSIIVLIGLIAFRDWKIPLYSWIVIFITGKVIDLVLEGMSINKSVMIVTTKYNEIRSKILDDLNRSGTLFKGEGLYKGDDKMVIHTVLTRRELMILEDFINKTDPGAFVTISDAHEILGEGFKSLNDKIA